MINEFKKPYLIAEIGSSHLGNMKLAKETIAQAKKGGADCVKFQLYDENTIVHPKLKTLAYIKYNNFKYQKDRFAKMKISLKDLEYLYRYSKKIKIDFCVTPFDPLFVKQISRYVKFFKVASGDLNYYPLLKELKKTKKFVLISTGMSNYKDIQNSLKYLDKKRTVIMHCVSSYPTQKKDINLSNIKNLNDFFSLPVGFSDHTSGIDATIASVFFGAKVIEKHFIPMRGAEKSADFALSVNYKELKQIRQKVDEANIMIGKKKDHTLQCEKYGEKNLKRSIYANKEIKKGERFNKNNLIGLRPFIKKGIGIEYLYKLYKKKASKNIKKFNLIEKKHIKN